MADEVTPGEAKALKTRQRERCTSVVRKTATRIDTARMGCAPASASCRGEAP